MKGLYVSDIVARGANVDVSLPCWLRARRKSGGILFLDVVVMFVLVRRILNVSWSTLIPRQMLAFIVLSLVFLLAGLCLTALDFSFLIRMLSFSIGLTIVVSLFWFQTLPEERDSMRVLVNKFIAR